MKKISEKEIQKQIIDYLRLKKYLVVKFHSSIFVGKRGQEGRFIKSPQVGVSDIIACQPETGRYVAIEVKKEGNQPSKFQLDFLAEVRARKGIGFVAYSLDDVMKELENL